MSVIHAPSRPKLDPRLLVFPAFMLVLLLVLFFRLWYLQVVRAQELTDRADATRSEERQKTAPRGLIYDRNGELLAGLKPQIVVSVTYSEFAKSTDEAARLATVLGVSREKVMAKLANARHTPSFPAPIEIGVSTDVAQALTESRHEFPGIDVDLIPMRYYPNGVDYAHVLGTVRLPSPNDLKRLKLQNIEPAEFVGKGGVERAYEKQLMGTAGKEVMDIDAKRHPIRVVKRDNPVPGDNLVLSLDSHLQHLAAQEMAGHNYTGAVVAVDPNTGEILCFTSSPTFDQNLFQNGISTEDFQKLQLDPNSPLTSRPSSAEYSPGSTFKIVTSLAAYEKGIFDPNRPVDCEGAYHLGTAKFKCLGHHGLITFHNALIKSCNTYFADLGYRTGVEQLRKTCGEVGLGQATEIDAGSERLGLVPSDAFLKRAFKNRHWYGGDTVNLSIGQGFLVTTPLQMCDIAEMVANRGVIYRPHFVHKVEDISAGGQGEPVSPEVLHKVTAGSDFWNPLQEALKGVIESGTAQKAQIPNVEWAGKTGSTEHGHKLTKEGNEPKTHSWFIGYAPFDHPKIAICVLVEDAGHGGDVAAPIARDVVADYLKRQAAKDARKVASLAANASAPAESPSLR
jgi:penicillin-binding protein 2